jgi:O-antigen/teichoic acid export membrane protein
VKQLSDRAGFLIAANLIKYAVGFFLPMLLVRILTKTDYGTYQQLTLIGNALLGFLTLGLPTSIYYFYNKANHKRIAALVVQTSFILLLSGTLALVILGFGAPIIAQGFNNPSLARLLPYYAISSAFLIASEHSTAFFIAQDRFRSAVIFETCETFVRVLVLIAPVLLGHGLFGLVIGLIVYSVLRYLARAIAVFSNKQIKLNGWTQNTFFFEQLEYSLPLALVSLCGLIGNTFNRGILASAYSPAEYAIFSVGALSIPLDVIFQASVADVLRGALPPLIREGKLYEVARTIREATRKLAIIVLPSFVFLLGFSQEFISLLFTSQYADSVPVFRIFVWLVPLHIFVLSMIPQAFGKTRVNLYVVIGSTISYLILSYLLLKKIGFYGPAIAAVATSYGGVIVYAFVALKLTKTRVFDFFPLLAFAKIISAALIAFFVARVSVSFSSGMLPMLIFLLAGVIFSATFILTAVAVRVFTIEDKQLIHRWLKKILPL